MALAGDPEENRKTVLLLFESATLVLWAEEVAREAGIPADVVPAPPDLRGVCGLALQAYRSSLDALRESLQGEGIEFQLRD